jgi:hypothetical protein
MLAGMKILYTQNNSLTSDLPEKKKHDGWTLNRLGEKSVMVRSW